jgi:glycosyltransferase involved in cell wall biosynthesis
MAVSGRSTRILYIVTEDWYFLSHRLAMARAAKAAGFEVHVATNVEHGADAITREGFILHPVPFTRGRIAPIGNLATITALRSVQRAVAPDVVHRVALQPVVLGALAGVGLGGASVNAITGLGHTFITDSPKARAVRACIASVLRLLINRSGHIALVQNPDDKALLSGMGFAPERIALIPGSGVDARQLRPSPEPPEPITLGFVGRLLDDKGIRPLIAALRLLRSRGVDIQLLIAGTPDPANPASVTDDEIAAWGRQAGIVHLGHVRDIATVWQRAHIAVLPSRREGLPKSLLEAAACGRPLVATDVPGCREIAVAGETGLLVPVDDPTALAQAIETLVHDPHLRQHMGQAARRMVETRFSDEIIGQATVDLYRRLIDKSA